MKQQLPAYCSSQSKYERALTRRRRNEYTALVSGHPAVGCSGCAKSPRNDSSRDGTLLKKWVWEVSSLDNAKGDYKRTRSGTETLAKE